MSKRQKKKKQAVKEEQPQFQTIGNEPQAPKYQPKRSEHISQPQDSVIEDSKEPLVDPQDAMMGAHMAPNDAPQEVQPAPMARLDASFQAKYVLSLKDEIKQLRKTCIDKDLMMEQGMQEFELL